MSGHTYEDRTTCGPKIEAVSQDIYHFTDPSITATNERKTTRFIIPVLTAFANLMPRSVVMYLTQSLVKSEVDFQRYHLKYDSRALRHLRVKLWLSASISKIKTRPAYSATPGELPDKSAEEINPTVPLRSATIYRLTSWAVDT